jgi:hypothetical protein
MRAATRRSTLGGMRARVPHDCIPPETAPELSQRRLLELAERHLAQLAETQRPHASRTPPAGAVKARTTWALWWVRRQSGRIGVALEAVRRTYRTPRRLLGRWRTHAAVLDWGSFFHVGVLAATLTVLIFIVDVVWVRLGFTLILSAKDVFGASAKTDATMRTISDVVAAVTGLSAAAAIALLWNDFVRCPFAAWQMRRRTRRRPVSILPTAAPATRRGEIRQDDPLESRLVPRDALYDEILPGVLRRHRRDVQVIVGEPGSGKTTALLGIAQLVARVGMVPVAIPIRGETVGDILSRAEEAFTQQVRTHSRSTADSTHLWRWLYTRKRLVVLIDDIDQVGADGERGYVLRQTLDRLATRDIAVVATARPAGIPAGVAASSVDLGSLDPTSVVRYVTAEARKRPEARASTISDRELRRWVDEGQLAETPFYLEILASLHAAGRCRELPPASTLYDEGERSGRLRQRSNGGWELNPIWVQFRLLDAYYEGIREGVVQAGLGIENVERTSSLDLLEDAALKDLRAIAQQASTRAEALTGGDTAPSRPEPAPRPSLQELIDTRDRERFTRDEGLSHEGRRSRVSAHEAIDTGERLRLLDRDQAGRLQFRHRIMQAYLAGRRLARYQHLGDAARAEHELSSPLNDLLDRHNPEKLTAHMALTFAALHAHDRVRRHPEAGDGSEYSMSESAAVDDAIRRAIVSKLLDDADHLLENESRGPIATPGHANDPTDPRNVRDPEDRRDPDAALANLTTAATIVRALWSAPPRRASATAGPAHTDIVLSLRLGQSGAVLVSQVATPPRAEATTLDDLDREIVKLIRKADGATRWTKLKAIAAIAELQTPERWNRLWEYARDRDYKVRRAAAKELQRKAHDAYAQLREEIEALTVRAAARSALNLPIATPSHPGSMLADHRKPAYGSRDGVRLTSIDSWEKEDVLSLVALGWVLPAIVSGLREDRGGDHAAPGAGDGVHDARHALEEIVTLAFQGGQHDFEASVAQGFKDDAMRHAADQDGRIGGPGWVASNRRLVGEICLDHAEGWYSRMLLYQALALYAIAGANRRETHTIFARMLDPARETNAFVRRAAKLARRAVERKQVGSESWTGLIWDDEGEVVSRRASVLDDVALQLAADVTLLLNLNERSPEDRQMQFGHMHDLPHCLGLSSDRNEILGAGCPPTCGWGLCPYVQPPPDEPNAHRGVSRAFCRQQQQVTRRWRRAPWQRGIRRSKLERFWREMERRARS